jgi:hypothetical protein
MTYREKLEDPRWQRRRLEFLSVKNWKCERCGATHLRLDVHHKCYRKAREPWEYGDDELECICKNCHAEEHGKRVAPAPKLNVPLRLDRGRLVDQALTIILQYPIAARSVAPPSPSVKHPHAGLLRELFGQALSMIWPTTAVLLERWRDRLQYAQLAVLVSREPMIANATDAALELRDIFEKIEEAHGAGRRMDDLLCKAEERGLSFEEKRELGDLLRTKVKPRATG